MITFTVICCILAVVAGALLATLVVGSGILAGVGLVIADVVLGLLPFIGIFLLIKWLLKKRA